MLFILFSSTLVSAQLVSGVVKDKKNGFALESVNVVLKPSNHGAVTNIKGQFIIEDVKPGDYSLIVSLVGFGSRTIQIQVKENDFTEVEIVLTKKTEQINEVAVIGKEEIPNLIELPSKEALSINTGITKISLADIQKQGSTTLLEALKFVPGGWTESRGRKVKQFFSVRGQKYPYPSYSLNGIWQKEFHETPYILSSGNIEEIKVIRSSAALIKSLSPLVGVIDVTTRKPVKEELDVSMKYGTLNTYQNEMGYSNLHKNMTYSVRVGGFGTSGPDRRNGKENIWNAQGNLNWKINERWDWSVNMIYVTGSRELVQPIEPADAKFMNRAEKYDPIHTMIVSSKLRYCQSSKLTSELDISFVSRNATYNNNNLSNGSLSKYKEEDFELTFNQLNTLKLSENNSLRFGALYNYWEAPEGKRFYSGNTARIHTISGVIADQHQFGKFVVDGGFRLTGEYFDQWGGFSIEGSGSKFKKVLPIKEEWQSVVWNTTLGLSYLCSSKSSWHYAIAAGIVTPRKGALTSQGEAPENETRMNFDLGYSRNIGHQGKASLTAFWVNRKNAIALNGSILELDNGDFMELYDNKDSRNYGVEAEFKSPTLWKALNLFTNVTYMKGEVQEESEWTKDDEMPNWVINMGANYQRNRWDANVFMHHVNAYKNDRFVSKTYLKEQGKAPLGNYVTVDLNAGYMLHSKYKMRLFGEIKNVFDKKYQTVVGYPDYGTVVSIGVNMKL